MREILFRGKRTDNGEWVEGLVARYNPKFDCANIVDGFESLVPVKTETVGQYTGLTDKNGKKIFEGDILHFKAHQGGGFVCPIGTDIYYRVVFGCCNPDMDTLTDYIGFWALGLEYCDDDLYQDGWSIQYLVHSHGACIVGNIHDNPEFLEVQNDTRI